tara:strand:- start:1504 stop:2139 length:636 start_codon:yes stop_codon:yes gene_type:complete
LVKKAKKMNYSLAIAYDILYNTYIDSRKGAKNKMMTEHKLAINFDTNVTVSDILEQKTLDVTSLKQDTPEGKVREHVDEVEALDARANELEQIAAFIKLNGVTTPTEEDYKPKSQLWGRAVKSKAQQLAENPNYIERRGRPRQTYTKNVTFVLSAISPEGELNDEFKRTGRGRAKKGEKRLVFALHHTNVDKVSDGTYTRKQLIEMGKRSN